ncbi:MAG TPA: glycosyltransferase [Gemmatimonadaceae bacterium]|nr:glycosyltransferase [Gemmatimonadaceae bacterium]
MNRRLLVACFEPPGYGGASTATYALFERMQGDGLDVSYLTLLDPGTEPFLHQTFGAGFDNPRQLANVRTHRLEGPFHQSQPALAAALRDAAPEVVLAVGYIAALAVKQAAPHLTVILFTAGCDQVDRYLPLYGDAVGVCAALQADRNPPLLFHAWERRAVELVDLILVHSDLVRALFTGFYPYHAGKVYPEVIWMIEWIWQEAARHAALSRPFESRDIDLLFVSSRWDRYEKNFPLARAIIEECPDLRAHVVGLGAPPAGRSVRHGLLTSRRELFALMGRARTVVSPSRADAAPGILYEADALGCNVVASRNCGNWPLCHPALLAQPYAVEPFVAAARRASGERYESGAAALLARESYATLLDICATI